MAIGTRSPPILIESRYAHETLVKTDVSSIEYLTLVSCMAHPSPTESDPLPATRGGKGLAHTNRASGSGLHRKTVEEIKLHSMNHVKGLAPRD